MIVDCKAIGGEIDQSTKEGVESLARSAIKPRVANASGNLNTVGIRQEVVDDAFDRSGEPSGTKRPLE